MREGSWQCEGRTCREGMREMGKVLHALCQPLTTLQCRLEMAGMKGTAEAYREAVELGLAECARLNAAVGSMREIVRESARRLERVEAEEMGAGR